ncbi:YscO family type III secretion system apparatus protein [Pseudomonas sp. Marseille-Q1929]|uniref:type III secretion system stalk subunit SctO n=1 Tax=Pseudomonas sp. Marseille-Q1929 TaxID=2730402 RepID=UPI001A8DDAB3|nr:YscO family type III secretion system apparatus protein [Pseudomonas sp. Marseille-Q1929]MBO0492106.1 YscO family type III secretion system apparatus protein [Pseudomonas sp. Marseille-Q1929]
MSHSDAALSEIETLRRLRRHRADRAERALREAKRAEQTLLAHIRQAADALEQTRQEEVRQSAQLLSEHQGQVLSLQALKSWGLKERSLCAGTQREAGQLQALQGQQDEKKSLVGTAQKHVTECLRQVEKLKELALLLAEEQT